MVLFACFWSDGVCSVDTIYVNGIAITKTPDKTDYQLGDAFDGSGLSVTFYLADAPEVGDEDVSDAVLTRDLTRAEVSPTAITGTATEIDFASGLLTVTGFDSSISGSQSLGVVYTAEDGAVYTQNDAFAVTIAAAADTTGGTGGSGSSGTPSTGDTGFGAALALLALALVGIAVTAKKRSSSGK